MVSITSRTNPKIKLARALYRRKIRREKRLFICEGLHLVGEAIASEAKIHSILFSPELLKGDYAPSLLSEAERKNAPLTSTTPDVFCSVASKENPQGILAIVHQPELVLPDLNPETFSFGVALVSPQDPGNIGTILRTIEAVGAGGLLILDGGADAYHPSSVRASMGAIFWKPVVQSNLEEFLSWSTEKKYHVYGTSAHGDTDYRDVFKYKEPLILLLGSEREGLHTEYRAMCERLIRLPIAGRSSSLNLAVAAGVLLYDIYNKSSIGVN